MLLNAFRRIFRKAQNRKARRSYTCPQLLQLESRIVPANFQVTSLADTATGGTLREAIDLANTTAGNDTIGFAPSLFSSGAGTITLLTAQLPQILNASTIVGAGTRGTLTITGPGASTLTISGNNGVSGRNFHILNIASGGNLAISGVTFSGAKTTGAGGAIENAGTLTVSGSIISGNSANDGGGITNWGTLTVINTTISGNTSITQAGGGIQNSSGSLTVTNSTISGNTAATQAGGIQNNGILVVTNSTISGNTALTQSGGGIYNFTTGTLTLSGTTIAGNSANDGGGIRNIGALNISNTIIANSTSGGDFSGNQPGTSTNNLITIGTLTGATTVTSAELNLGPLQNNGGPTFTMALRTGSVAIGAGNATISNASPINGLDQRGINRTTSDIGAYSFGIQVTNTSDSNTVGSGSLRAAINLANTTPGNDQIRFNLTGLNTIILGSALPTIVSASTGVGSGTAGTVTITGLGASLLTIDGNKGNFSIFSIASGGNLSISGVTVSGANTSGNGGAFNNAGTLAVSGSTISGNSAISKGGGFYNQGNLFISDSVITGNSVTGWTGLMYGGGIYNGNTGSLFIANTTISSNSSATHAGGISNLGISTITNSTISNNSTVYSAGGILNNGILKLSNSTIFGNSATKTSGGGIFNNTTLDIFNTTIAGNSANDGGGIYVNGGNLNISNTIIANSTSGGDFSGAQPVTSTNNLITIGTLTGATPVTSAQLNLGPLQNNGGPTFTMALGAGSAAIGAGNATISNAAPINGKDQRGVTRSSTAPSIGAFEYNGTMPSAPTVTLNTTNNLVINATTLTIAGTGFSTTAANNTVTFSSGTGHVTSATSTQLTVTFDTAPSLGSLTAIVTTNSVSSGAAVQVATIFGTATQATLTTPAAGAPSGSAFTTQPVITIKDAAGNTVTNSTASVTMTVSSGATTLGTTTINAVAGIATFTNVGISGIAGTPYTLTFTSTGLTSATQTITPTFSSTFTVSTTANSGLGSLSAAITLANTTPGDDQIVFNLTGLNTITLGSALPTIVTASTVVGSGTAGTVTITGLGASSLIISGNNGDVNRNFSIFSIASSGNLSISGVTVSGAQTSGLGGAFNNSGTLTVNNSNISGNTANLSGGFSFGSGGGGIWNGGDLTVTNSTISGNTTSSRGGGILNYGATTITNSTISGNTGTGIFNNSGNLAVTNSTISGNTGGGINVYTGTLTVTNSTISANTSTNGTGGGIFNNSVTTVINSTISGNTANRGGGIFNNKGYAFFSTQGGCTLTVTNSTISGNSATNGGGIYNSAGTSGIANSTLNIANTIIANSTNGGDYAGGGTVTLISPATSASNLVTQTGALVSAWATPVTSAQLNLGPLQNNGGPTSTIALGAGSVAIGAGNATISNTSPINKLDQRGINRTTSDIGAYSFGIQVTNTSDSNTVGSGSLRAAINLANTTPGNDQISFNLTGLNTITLGSALPTIVSASTVVGSGTAGTVTITGLGASSLIISGSDPTNANNANRNFNIFNIASGGNLSISGVTVSGANTSGNGGAFNNSGTLTVNNSNISNNKTTITAFASGGGGIWNAGALTVNNSIISSNISKLHGGGIWNAGTLMVNNSTISGNTANSTTGYGGGGIFNYSGNLAITNSTLSGNIANNGGGGINVYRGTLTVTNSTISGNTADVGGGIFNNNVTTVINSTISGNTATNGGGIYNNSGGDFFGNKSTGCTLTVINSTLSGNSATNGGGIYNRVRTDLYHGNSTLNIANTIIANSTSGGDYAGGGTVTLISPATSASNLVTQTGALVSAWATTVTSAQLNLGPLQNNGGPTFTMALRTGSVAIGAGNATISNAAPINKLDQRGINRTTSDIGAYSFGIQVTNTSDSNTVGSGSLRAAINLANTTPGDDQIVFNLTGLNTITLGSALPTIVTASTVVGSGTAGTVTITGLGASSLIISGNNGDVNRNFSIFSIASSGNLSISGVTISDAKTSGRGGAFNNSGTLTVINSTISGNTAGTGGGGIVNYGTLTVSKSTISGNTSNSGGGGIVNNSGTFSISNSTISGNTTSTGAGGGINNNNGGTLNIANSTISGNTASTNGGGIFSDGTLTVINSTISGNTASTGAGGGINNGGTLNIANSIIANSTNGGDYAGGGSIGTNSNNLVEDGTLPGTSEITGDPQLGPLQNNGGTTFTMALGTGSAAIGAGNATISNARPINGKDQRGYARSSTAPSIGAFEYIPATQATLTTTAVGAPSGSAFTTQPVITLKDTFGNTVNTNVSVTMTVSSGATTVGTTINTVNAVNGVATFSGVGISGTAGTPYTLTFTSTGLTVATQTITPTFGLATQATNTTSAAGSVSGSAFTTQPIITIKDAAGNTVTNSTASVTMTVSSGASTIGTTINTVNAVNGVATFSGVGISGAAGTPYTLTFTSTGLTIATQSITPTFGTATQAALTTPAAGFASGSAFTTQPIITLKDSIGNTVNTNASVTMTVSSGATTLGMTTINAVAGIATFTDVGISGIAGTPYTLTFTSGSLTVTQNITPTFGIATQATLTPAAGSESGSAFTTQPIITIKDAFGNIVTNSTASVTMSVNGNGTTVGTTINTVNAVNGVVTFSGVGISGTAGTPYTLTFTSGSLTVTQNITPTFGLATQATNTTSAAGSASGSAFTTQPIITIKDAFGNIVTNSTASVTMSVNGNGTTVGTTINTVNAVNGVATFSGVGISGTAGTSYTLTFNSTGLTSAIQNITPTFGLATQAPLTTNPAGAPSGSAFTTQPIITIKDAFGNTVTNNTASVTMTVSSGDNKATTLGSTTINAVAGVATFSGVGISGTAGTPYTLTFTSGSFTATQSITATFGLATQATLTTQAAGSASGSAFTTQPVITIKDTFGNIVTNSTASVTMTVSSGDNKATTVGAFTINAVAGIATFTNVGISGTAGTPYTLTFTSTGLTIPTQNITPTFGLATQATITTPAAGAPSGLAFITQPVITINDTFGNPITNSTASVTMTVSGGASTIGTTTVNAVAGIVTFTNVGIGGAGGTSYSLTFASTGLNSATQGITPIFGPTVQVSSPSEPIPFPLGVSSTKDLAILTGINPATISGYVATIVWGDGSQNSAGTIALSPNQSGVFQVLGTHTYSSLEMFNGSVSVTSVFDNRIFSSGFNVEVLTAAQKEKINDISAEVLPPGGKTADVTISGVINSFYKQSANNSSPVILFTASYVSNPQPYTTTAPAQSFFDVRLRNPDPEAVLTLTANFSGGLQRGSSPYIQFAQDTSTSYQNVVSSNNLVVINYINNTITVLIDQNSFPLINNLRGTVFAVVTGATQVSSNTITVLPAAFTSGTAVGIAWGASSTVVDVATATTASNTTLTFQNSRKTTLSLAPSQSKGTVILRAVNNGGTTKDEASKETIKQLTNPDMLQSIIRGTIGIGPEVIGGMIKKMLPENAGNFLREWSKVISEIKAVSSDIITPEVKGTPAPKNNAPAINPNDCDLSLIEDTAFEDISYLHTVLLSEDESDSCLNGVSTDSMLEELAFSGEINWAGLALSTLALSQFRTFSKDKPKPGRPIKISA